MGQCVRARLTDMANRQSGNKGAIGLETRESLSFSHSYDSEPTLLTLSTHVIRRCGSLVVCDSSSTAQVLHLMMFTNVGVTLHRNI